MMAAVAVYVNSVAQTLRRVAKEVKREQAERDYGEFDLLRA
jgi:hypothetical protein